MPLEMWYNNHIGKLQTGKETSANKNHRELVILRAIGNATCRRF